MQTSTRTDACLDAAALLESIAFVAIEHEGSLDVTRLADLVDLYAHHLRDAAGTPSCSFEAFVRDALLLDTAARHAADESGFPTRAPAPLVTRTEAAQRRVPFLADVIPVDFRTLRPAAPTTHHAAL